MPCNRACQPEPSSRADLKAKCGRRVRFAWSRSNAGASGSLMTWKDIQAQRSDEQEQIASADGHCRPRDHIGRRCWPSVEKLLRPATVREALDHPASMLARHKDKAHQYALRVQSHAGPAGIRTNPGPEATQLPASVIGERTKQLKMTIERASP